MRPITLVVPVVILLAFATSGCNNPPAEDGQRSKLASDLVACQNELSSTKDKVSELAAKLVKAEDAAKAAGAVQLDGVDVKAGHAGGGGGGGGGASGGHHGIEGNVSPDAVVKVVRLNSGGLRACYEKALKRKPDLQYVSKVTARFSIKNTGNAADVNFSPHTDPDMEHCMATTMERWKFPTFQGDPVTFESAINLIAK